MLLVSLSIVCFCVALFAALLPVSMEYYSLQRFVLCVVIWLTAWLSLIETKQRSKPRRQDNLFLWFCPLLLFFLSGELYLAAYRVEPVMFFLFFFAALGLGMRFSKLAFFEMTVSRVLSVAALFSFVYALVALMNYALALSEGRENLDLALAWGVPNIRYWSHLAAWLIPLLAAAQKKSSLSLFSSIRVVIFVSGSLWWWILFSTSARGAAIGLISGALVGTFLFRRSSLEWARWFFLHSLAGLLSWTVLTQLIPDLLNVSSSPLEVRSGTSGRIPLWFEAWKMSLVQFPLGLGPQSWLTHQTITDAYASGKQFGHPHNMYLLWAAEYGWILICAMVIAAFGVFRRLKVRRQEYLVAKRNATLISGIIVSAVAACVHASVSAVFMAPASMLIGFLVLTLFFAWLQIPAVGSSSVPKQTRGGRFFLRMLAVLIILLGMFWFAEIYRYYHDNLEDRNVYEGQGMMLYTPRFWSHGDYPRQLQKSSGL
ncbi:MAG: hypothetical protein COB05_17090 [Marinobacter sp.]|nr:MAG: hypothetical protein COB05_17090 [Marinobacter sp.]